MKRVLYFGIFDPEFSRNKIYIRGLRERGVEVTLCVDTAPGLRKYWNLFKKHWNLRRSYEVLIVGYPGYIVVPFAKLLTRRQVVLDALCSFHETIILSRDAYRTFPFRRLYVYLVDRMATLCADRILVETDRQREYFIEVLGVPKAKLLTVYTGVDDGTFRYDPLIKKRAAFTVLFRGRITREAGVETVLRAAKLLESEGVTFLIIGYGWNDEMASFRRTFSELALTNVEHIETPLSLADMSALMQTCHVSLGQFSRNDRLKRTVPHKAFESFALRLPYITARAEGVCEVARDGDTCLMVEPEDPEALARAIRTLQHDPHVREYLAENAWRKYEEHFRPSLVVEPIVRMVSY